MMTHEDGEAELGPGETSGLFQFLSILCFSVQARTEARRTRLCDVVRLVAGAAWPGLALNTGGQFAVFISVISNYSARITRTTRPALLPDATQAMEQSHQSYQSLFKLLKNSLKSKVCP